MPHVDIKLQLPVHGDVLKIIDGSIAISGHYNCPVTVVVNGFYLESSSNADRELGKYIEHRTTLTQVGAPTV